MKNLLLSIICLVFSLALNAQQTIVLEDNTLVICDSVLNGGASADTMYLCQQAFEGTVIINGPCAEYTPNLNYFGYDSICLTTCIAGVCIDTVVNITVQPLGESIYQTTLEDAPFFVCEAVISGGSNVLIAGCSSPLFGTAAYNPACVIYSPPLNYVGLDSFCIVSCLDTLCDTSTLVMSITPVTETINVSVPGNGEITICFPALPTAVDSVSSFSLSCGPTNNNGIPLVNSAQQCVTYAPNANFDGTGLTGTDQICISVCNSVGICDETNININITGFQVTNNFDATQLAESLAGAGVSITGAFLNCPNNASGSFVNSPNALGLDDGIILTSGNAIDVQDASPLTFISTDNAAPGDLDLTNLIAATNPGLESTDACVLEFDVEVLGDSLTFNYVFGSEEYDEYVCSNFNDVFGFFVSGANPSGPAYVNQNVALIPGTTTPVSINSVNNGAVGASGTATTPGCNTSNAVFFNGTVTDIAYDGNTVALQSKILTTPCTSYHFKLGVADGSPLGAGDRVFDSGVFVEAGSFVSLPVTLASSTVLGEGFVNAVEGCVDGLFNFQLNEALPVDYGIKFQISGTAINGVDYNLIQDSLTFFAGDTQVLINIIPINDGLFEGTETVKLLLLNPCTSLPFDSAELSIIDLIPFNLTTIPDTICPGDTSILHATIAGDDNNLAIYNWTPNNGTILDVDSGYTAVTPSITSDFFVEYTLGGCTQSDTTAVFVSLFDVAYNTQLISCPGANDGGFTAIPSNSIGNVSYLWQPSASTDSFVNNLNTDTITLTIMDESGLSCGVLEDTLFLLEPTGLSFTTEITNVSCNGLSDGSVLIANLTPNSSYQVDVVFNGVPLPSQNIVADNNGAYFLGNLSPGVFDSIVIANLASGCSNSFGFTMSEPAVQTATIIAPGAVLCAGGTIDSLIALVAGGTAPYSFLWSTNDITQTITGLTPGSYWLEVTDSNSCVALDTFIVSQPNALALNILGDSASCFGENDGMVYVDSITGGAAPYTLQWDLSTGGQTTDTAVNLLAGTYILNAADFNGCPVSDTLTIYEPIALGLNIAVPDSLCFGGANGVLDATVSGGVSPYTYSWSGPNGFTDNQEDLAGLAIGTYNLTVSDFNNCLVNESIAIAQVSDVVISFTGTPVNCFGGNDGSLTAQIVSGGSAPFQFQWDAAANNQNTATAIGLISGTYAVIITDGNGCTFSNSASVSEPLSPLSLAMDSTYITCAGYSDGTATAVVSGGTLGYTYLWNDPLGQTTAQATDLSSNSYQVTVTDGNGCVVTGSVIIEEPSPVVVVLTTDSVNCWGDASGSINVFAAGGSGVGYSYSIDGGETFQSSPDFVGLPAGIYNEIVIQDLGSNVSCLSQSYGISVYEQPYFSFEVIPEDTTLQLEESLGLSLSVTSPNYLFSDIAQVSWFPTIGLNCTDCIDPTILTYNNYTNYTATAYYEGGDGELCNATANTTIQVENNLELFIPNAFTPGSFDNVNNTFEVFGEGIEFVTMQVFNRWGEKVFESSNQQVSWDGTFKGEMQGPGVFTYYVNVEYLDGKIIDRKGSVTILR